MARSRQGGRVFSKLPRSGQHTRAALSSSGMNSERRAHTRVPVDLWVEEHREGLTCLQRATNLSLGGIYFDHGLSHPPGTRLQLAMKLGAEEVDLVGEVVGAAHDTGTNVRFVDLDRTQRAVIANFLLSLHARTGD